MSGENVGTSEEIQVLKVIRLPGDRTLKAYVDVQVDDWIIYDWRILQRPGERLQVSVPQVTYRDKEGTVRFRALLSIPRDLRQRIEVAILSAWEKELKNGSYISSN